MHGKLGKARSLQIREVPESVYLSLQEEAERRHRSLAQQAIITLKKGLEQATDLRGRREQVLSRITLQTKSFKWPQNPDPVKWVREDRDR